MHLRGALITLLALLVVGCSETTTTPTETQVTLRIQIDGADLRDAITQLRVSVFRKDDPDWVRADQVTLDQEKLALPLDIPIVPRSDAALAKPFEVIIDAYAGEALLAHTRAVSSYVPKSLRVLEVWLYRCLNADNTLCAGADCHGPACAKCGVTGDCEEVGMTPAEGLPAYSASDSPVTRPAPGTVTGMMDAGEALDASESDGSETDTLEPIPVTVDAAVAAAIPDAAAPAPTCTPACNDLAECVISGSSASCQCPVGYELKSGACVDIDECAAQSGGCPAHATCQNKPGGHSCACDAGYEDKRGDGRECTDKCAAAGCDPHATCTVVGVEPICNCAPPYVGDGKTCSFDQSCSLLKCDAHATCVVTGASRECRCRSGYTGNGTQCADVDECKQATNPCGANSTCANSDGAYTCGCVTGYRRNGNSCENIPDCSPNPCLNGGVCSDGINAYTCNCASTGFEGARCQTNSNNCAPNPCLNGGTCSDGTNTYTCACPAAFTGAQCQTNVCATNPCMNGGTCRGVNHQATCSCPTGFSGTRCETNNPDCVGNRCVNGSTCVDGINRYTCSCAAGYTGDFCEREICGPVTINRSSDLQAFRNCGEIRGDLSIDTSNAGVISAEHFPNLTVVTGTLSAFMGPADTFNYSISITMGSLRTVNRIYYQGAFGPQDINLPNLTTITDQFVVGGGLDVISAPRLTTIGGALTLSSGFLCQLDLPALTSVGSTNLMGVPQMPLSAFNAVKRATRGKFEASGVGCCDATDRIGCSPYSPGQPGCGCF